MESFLLLFSRALGFFYFSPLFRWQIISPFLRFALALITSLIVAPSITPPSTFPIVELLIQGFIGYLLGFLFSLLFEGVALAGEVIGTMMGLSMTELFQPLTTPSSPLLSRLFTLLATVLFFALDLHHIVFRTLFENLSISTLNLKTITSATSHLFTQAFLWGAFPFLILTIILITLAIASRMFPDLPILWMGFPIQLLGGLVALVLTFREFPKNLMQFFTEITHFVERIFNHLI